MASFVLVPGAGGMAWIWSRVMPLLQKAGHEAIAIDLPADDPQAGLAEYTDIVVQTVGDRPNVILVAQSLGGFTAPPVCERASVGMLVFVNAMIPKPGETAGAWFEITGVTKAREQAARENGYPTKIDMDTYFMHDIPPEVVRTGPEKPREQAENVFGEPCRFTDWPKIPIHILSGKDDRFFPVGFQRRVARERLGKDIEVLPGGHLLPLSQPSALTTCLLGRAKDQEG